jgi:hypothetical protein
MYSGADAGSADDCAADSAATMVMLATVHRRRVPRCEYHGNCVRVGWRRCTALSKWYA